MILRPMDASGDILPVRSSSGLLSGPEAAAQLIRFRLSLLPELFWFSRKMIPMTTSTYLQICGFFFPFSDC